MTSFENKAIICPICCSECIDPVHCPKGISGHEICLECRTRTDRCYYCLGRYSVSRLPDLEEIFYWFMKICGILVGAMAGAIVVFLILCWVAAILCVFVKITVYSIFFGAMLCKT